MTLPDIAEGVSPSNIRSAQHLTSFVSDILSDSGVASGLITQTPMPPLTTWEDFRDNLRRRDSSDEFMAGYEQWYVWIQGGAKPLRSDTELLWHETREVNIYGLAALGAYSDSRERIQERTEALLNYAVKQSTRSSRHSSEPYITLPNDLRARFWHGPVGEMHFYQTSIVFPLTLELQYTKGRYIPAAAVVVPSDEDGRMIYDSAGMFYDGREMIYGVTMAVTEDFLDMLYDGLNMEYDDQQMVYEE